MLQTEFNQMIGELDHLLSRLKIACSGNLTEANRQTLSHHADDMEGMVAHIRKRLALMPEPKAPAQDMKKAIDAILERWSWLGYRVAAAQYIVFYDRYVKSDVIGISFDGRDSLEEMLQKSEGFIKKYLESTFKSAPSLELLRRLHEGWQIVHVGRNNYCARRNGTALERFGDLQYLHDDLTRIESGVRFDDQTTRTFTAEHI